MFRKSESTENLESKTCHHSKLWSLACASFCPCPKPKIRKEKKNSSLRKLIRVFITFPTATNPEVSKKFTSWQIKELTMAIHAVGVLFVPSKTQNTCWLIAMNCQAFVGHLAISARAESPSLWTLHRKPSFFVSMESFGTLVFQQRWPYGFNRQGSNPLLPLPFAELSPFSQMDCSDQNLTTLPNTMICWWTELRPNEIFVWKTRLHFFTFWLHPLWQDLHIKQNPWCLAG